MANIRVVYDGLFIATSGLYQEVLSMDSPTLEKVIQAMAARHGSKFTEMLYDRNTGGIATGVTILVNGTQVGPMATPLGETDEVAFLFPIAGGAYA